MQTVAISEQNRNSLKGTNKMACPNCGRTDGIGNVVSYGGKNGAVVYRKYCRNCYIEFDAKGRMFPPLYY